MAKITNIKSDSRFIRLDVEIVREISNFLFALGNKFVDIGNSEAAFDCFKYSVDLNSKNHPAVYNLGCLYNITGDLEGAYRMFKEAIRMNGGDLMARVSLLEVTRKLGRMEEAKELFDVLYEAAPEEVLVLSAGATLNYDLGRLAEANWFNDKALEKTPTDVHVLLNQALLNMTFGQWSKWWQYYEFCLSYQKNERMHGLKMSNAWSGEEHPGETLIVVSDQGFGDAIQFSRYLQEAKDKGKFEKILYLVQTDLRDLLQRVQGVDEAIGFGDKINADFKSFSSLLGIMRVLQIDPDNCYRDPHIVTDPQLDELWKCRIESMWDGSSKKIGIVWAGDVKHGNDRNRSLPLAQFLKILHGSSSQAPVSGLQLFSFQVGDSARQLQALELTEIVDLGEQFRSFDDTASALRQMDLLISCDTSIVHLAGCMGIPTWVLLPNPPEWRWLLDRPSTYWYPTVHLYRQHEPKNWDTVIEAVMSALKEHVWQS